MRKIDNYIIPEWPAPENVHAYTTTRLHGHSTGPFASFNLSQNVGDNEHDVVQNQQQLTADLQLPEAPLWIHQVHHNTAVNIAIQTETPDADASYTRLSRKVCAILTADCLPILVCNRQGTEVAAIHAGWKGLLVGVIESTIRSLQSDNNDLMAWLGPAIGPKYLELNEDIMFDFCSIHAANKACFTVKSNKVFADIYGLAKNHLNICGVKQIFGGNYCTFSDADLFYSYRRDNQNTGRMASLIWFSQKQQ